MKEFDYIIIGGGCAGLSLAYELEINEKFKDKTLAIIEPRQEYKRDKTWSFWKVVPHNFDDCIIKSWDNFSINIPNKTNYLECKDYPYQSIDSGLFYEKINNKLKENKNIHFFKDLKEINTRNSFIFNSVPDIKKDYLNLWQHFCGVEIETKNNIFDDEIFNLMDFDCDQRNSVHFFFTLPYSKNKALVEYKKSSFTFLKFLRYIIVFVLSVGGLFLVLDTFKIPLSNFFPELELILFNFYEIFHDIFLFLKDLIR